MSQASECETCGAPPLEHSMERGNRKKQTALFSGAMLTLGLLIEYLGLGMALGYLAFIMSAASAGFYIVPKGLRGLARLNLDMHFLMTVASVGAMLIGAPAEGASVMFLFFISLILEDRAGEQVRKDIQALMELEPTSVTVRKGLGEACVRVENVHPGDIIIIRPGERIGLDGIVIEGQTSVNEASITGESVPVAKSKGSTVLAGTINNEGYVEVEVTVKSSETLLSRIVTLVEEARMKKAPTERFVARFSRVYTPTMLLLSLLLGVLSLSFGATMVQATYRSLTLIVISCPCAFAVSIPVSIVSAITGSARNGVLVKGGAYIESLSSIGTVAFDKTGTLTRGSLAVGDVCLHNGHTRAEVLSAALALERRSEHPIAEALRSVSEFDGTNVPDVQSFTTIPGRGVKGTIGGAQVVVGNRQLLVEEDVRLDPLEEHVCGVGTMVYVADNDEHLGTIIMSDTLRESTLNAIRELRAMGIRTVMLTGDSTEVAREVARIVGVDEFRAELLPHEKVEAIDELRQDGGVLMLGDGINDAPALAAADVGMSMGAASSDIALETADVALMDQDLEKIPGLLKRAKKTMAVVKQNVAASLIVKASTGILAALGLMTLWLSIGIGDMGLTFAVVANALRLARRQ